MYSWEKINRKIFGSKQKEKYYKICPKCGSTEVKTDFSNPVVWNYGATVKYQCKSCGHLGEFFPEVTEDKKRSFKSKAKTHRKLREPIVDAETGFSIAVMELIFFGVTIVSIASVLLGFIFGGLFFLIMAGGIYALHKLFNIRRLTPFLYLLILILYWIVLVTLDNWL